MFFVNPSRTVIAEILIPHHYQRWVSVAVRAIKYCNWIVYYYNIKYPIKISFDRLTGGGINRKGPKLGWQTNFYIERYWELFSPNICHRSFKIAYIQTRLNFEKFLNRTLFLNINSFRDMGRKIRCFKYYYQFGVPFLYHRTVLPCTCKL